ncbi:MAG: zeta toxin family protein [Holosporales bacterium]|jgi:aminoglycoside phosphotransferase (APT) family kinase protein|nr:zeta toxin family protein [Holosporales bacterium]
MSSIYPALNPSARTKAIMSIYESFARNCTSAPYHNIHSEEFEALAKEAYLECIDGVKLYNKSVRTPYLVRLVGQSGSGKTTQLYEAVKDTIAHEFVHVSVRRFAKFHPEYEQIKNEFGASLMREKTNGFALLLLFHVVEMLIESKYSILLELTVLDQRFEAYLLQLTASDYHTIYNVLAVPREISDQLIKKRQQQEGRIVNSDSADYFFEKLVPSLRLLSDCDSGKTRIALWNAYSYENIADEDHMSDGFLEKVAAEHSKRAADIALQDPVELMNAKKKFYAKMTYFDSSLTNEEFLAILMSAVGESKYFPPKHGSFQQFVESVRLTPVNTGWTNFVFDVELDGVNYIARFPRGACFSRAMKVDVAASEFVKNETNLPVADSKIYFSGLRPFSIHKKIGGRVLSSTEGLTPEQVNDFGAQIATFFVEIHKLTPPRHLQRRLSTFLRDVMSEVEFCTCSAMIDKLEHAENGGNLVVVHGDLNIGNIIVNDDLKIVGFLDFAFFGVSVPEADLARITCRIGKDLFDSIITHYERTSGRILRQYLLSEMIDMWAEIEQNYIAFMAQTMPDIKV